MHCDSGSSIINRRIGNALKLQADQETNLLKTINDTDFTRARVKLRNKNFC